MAISVAVPVGEETANRLRAKLVERVNQLRVGHSLDPKADYGPLVTGAALARVKDYISLGVEAGAEIVVDGRERASDELSFGDANLENGYFVGPTRWATGTTRQAPPGPLGRSIPVSGPSTLPTTRMAGSVGSTLSRSSRRRDGTGSWRVGPMLAKPDAVGGRHHHATGPLRSSRWAL